MCEWEPKGGYSEVWREEWRASRRYRRCYSCAAVIFSRERYLSVFSVYERDASTYSLCEICGEAMHAFSKAHGACMADVTTMLHECSDDGAHEPLNDPWKYWLYLIDMNARRSQWMFAKQLAAAWGAV